MAEQPGHPRLPAAPSGPAPPHGAAGPRRTTGPYNAAAPPVHAPSGLFPSGPPPRPTYREPYPIRPGAIVAGAAGAAAWLVLFGLLGQSLVGYLWWTVAAGVAAWAVALVLAVAGDRGAAVGIAMVTAVGWAIAATALSVRWASTGDWPLW